MCIRLGHDTLIASPLLMADSVAPTTVQHKGSCFINIKLYKHLNEEKDFIINSETFPNRKSQ